MLAMADDASYVIRSGTEALGRLELLARVCRPTTESFLGRVGATGPGGPGSFLDVGCGIGDVAVLAAQGGATRVLGVDINPGVVAGAAERAARIGAPVQFAVAGLDDLGAGELVDFDVVYSRCMLSHLPDPVPALRSMLAAVRPGGWVLVEDVEVAAVWGSPFDPALARSVELYVAAAHGMGARPDVGPELAVHLRALGACDVDIDVVQPVLRTPDEIRIHARTMEAIAEPVVSQGLATVEEVADLVTRLDAWAAEPGVVATLPRLVQVQGRRPAA